MAVAGEADGAGVCCADEKIAGKVEQTNQEEIIF